VFRNGQTEEERMNVLCGLVKPRLQELRNKALETQPIDISMRMTKGPLKPLLIS
jgi:hypothetical protein